MPDFAVPTLTGAFCRNAACLTLAGICSTSRTTCFAGLSSRTPFNEPWRTSVPPVQPRKSTSTTMRGSTHFTLRRCSSGGIFSSGELLRANGVEPSLQVALRFLAPAGADPPGIAQAVLVVVAEQQRADQPPALVGGLVAEDDELLVAGAFGLEPVAAAAGAIGRVGAL